MPTSRKLDTHQNEIDKKHSMNKKVTEETEDRKKLAAATMHAQKRAAQLAPFRDSTKSKNLKDTHADLQNLLDNFANAISPIAPAILQVLKIQRGVLGNTQKTSLIEIGKTFAELPLDLESPNRSMQQNLDKFIHGMKKLTQFIAENPELIVGVATLLFPAIAPVSGFLSQALKFLLSSALATDVKEPLVRATERAKNVVDHTESALRDASHLTHNAHRMHKPDMPSAP